MSYYQTCAIPKPEPRKTTKARKSRVDAKALKAFRDAVWHRAMTWVGYERNYARCKLCGGIVYRDKEPRGEVHHRISRRHKGTRYDPANGVILLRAVFKRLSREGRTA